jgi:hypothetical protein
MVILVVEHVGIEDGMLTLERRVRSSDSEYHRGLVPGLVEVP